MKTSWYLLGLFSLFLTSHLVTNASSQNQVRSGALNNSEIRTTLYGPARSWEWQLAKADYTDQLQKEEAKVQAEKAAVLAAQQQAQAIKTTPQVRRYTNPEEVAEIRTMIEAKWPGQWEAMDKIISAESGWRVNATNGATYGLGQANPGKKMASFGEDWQTNAITQAKWMMAYIEGTYGSPVNAWGHWQISHNY